MIARDDNTLLQFLRPAPTPLRQPIADDDMGGLIARTRSRLAGVCTDMPRELFEQLVMDVVQFKVKWNEPHHPSLFDRA